MIYARTVMTGVGGEVCTRTMNLWNAIRLPTPVYTRFGASRYTMNISLISVDSVAEDRVVAETEVVGRGSVIRWVCHGQAALLVHHPAFHGSAFTLPATKLLPTVSAHCHKEKIRSRFGHSPHLSPSLETQFSDSEDVYTRISRYFSLTCTVCRGTRGACAQHSLSYLYAIKL